MTAASVRFVIMASIALLTGPLQLAAEPGAGKSDVLHRAREPITPIGMAPLVADPRSSLGERLFRDPLLSRNKNMSCSSCHDLERNGTGARRPTTHRPSPLPFDIPTIFNVSANFAFGWRAEFTSIDRSNEDALTNAFVMNIDWQTLQMRLAQDRQYSRLFRDLYGHEADQRSVLDALRRFESSLSTPAPFDEFLGGNEEAISFRAKQGYGLFKEFGCSSCHQGANIGGNLVERFGLFAPAATDTARDIDLGRYLLTRSAEDIGVFRVPSLRNVAVTSPYFHDGREPDLGQAVRLMSEYQLGREIDDDDAASIVEFLKTLTGRFEGRPITAGPPEEGR